MVFLELFHFETERELHSNLNGRLVQLFFSNICKPFDNFVILLNLVILNKQDNSNSSPNAKTHFPLKAAWEIDAIDALED